MDLACWPGSCRRAAITVLRFEQPWRLAGPQGRRATAPARRGLAARGGRSGGGRLRSPGCRCSPAAAVPVPGSPAGPRTAWAWPGSSASPSRCTCPAAPSGPGLPELLAPTVPRLVLQGTRDTFGTAAELAADLAAADGGDPGRRWSPLPGADHGFKTPARAEFRAGGPAGPRGRECGASWSAPVTPARRDLGIAVARWSR